MLSNEFHKKLVEQDFLGLEDFVEEILEERCPYMHVYSEVGQIVNVKDVSMLFQVFTNRYSEEGLVAFLSNGDLVEFTKKHEKTGSMTWNGDDEYYANYAIKYKIISTVATSVKFKEFLRNEKMSIDDMREVAIEVCDMVVQYAQE